MKTTIFFMLMMVLVSIYGIGHRETTKTLKQAEQRLPVEASFHPKESTKDPSDTCFMLEGSKRSFHNNQKFNEKTKFEIVRVVDNDGNVCVRKILADGKVIEKPFEGDHCLDYKVPPVYCHGARSCVRVYDICI